jgi:hypothetical protein
MLLNGLILISAVLDFTTIDFNLNNDLPYILFLPAYAATAWYHGKLNFKASLKPWSKKPKNLRWANMRYRLAQRRIAHERRTRRHCRKTFTLHGHLAGIHPTQ